MLELEKSGLLYLVSALIILMVSFGLAFYIIRKLGKNPTNILPVNFAYKIRLPLLIFLASIIARIAIISKIFRFEATYEIVGHLSISKCDVFHETIFTFNNNRITNLCRTGQSDMNPGDNIT